ncbi:hypothetical protein QE152_g38504 [Popillia japonica]|uniref:Uncharacterized protein n=1 Tax=Popillia japonica TaxID=7064 RepID=A0AAW1HX96_POPJA
MERRVSDERADVTRTPTSLSPTSSECYRSSRSRFVDGGSGRVECARFRDLEAVPTSMQRRRHPRRRIAALYCLGKFLPGGVYRLQVGFRLFCVSSIVCKNDAENGVNSGKG